MPFEENFLATYRKATSQRIHWSEWLMGSLAAVALLAMIWHAIAFPGW
jgi:hypothetical protein